MKDDFEKLLTLLEQSMKSDDNESLSQLEKLIKNLSDNLKDQLEEPNTKKSLLNKDDLEKLRILLEKITQQTDKHKFLQDFNNFLKDRKLIDLVVLEISP